MCRGTTPGVVAGICHKSCVVGVGMGIRAELWALQATQSNQTICLGFSEDLISKRYKQDGDQKKILALTSDLHTCTHRQEHLYIHMLPPPTFSPSPFPLPPFPHPLSRCYKHFPQQLVSCFSSSSHSAEYQLSHQPNPASLNGFSFQETACLKMPSNPTARVGIAICPVGGTESTTARESHHARQALQVHSVERWVWLVKTASSLGSVPWCQRVFSTIPWPGLPFPE